MTQDCLLVFATDILVIDRVTSLHVNPAHVKSALLETTVKMFDITHHPHHFDASLECQMTLCLHLPPHVRRSPWPDFTKARDDNDLIQANNVTYLKNRPLKAIRPRSFGTLKAE